MGQCLVTKLKAAVSDTSLLKLGERTFVLLPNGKITMRVISDMPIRVVGNGGFLIGESASLTEGVIKRDMGYVTITNAENYAITLAVANLEQLQVFSTRDTGNNQQIEIDLSFFENSHAMSELALVNEVVVGGTLKNLSKISEASTLTNFTMKRSIGIVGSILDVANLNYVDSAFPNFAFCADITGELVEFVNVQRAKGRTSANISSEYYVQGTNITFNGQKATDIDALEPKAISWTETTITLGSKTINA